MQNAILLHGHGDGPQSYWFPWLVKKLQEESFAVWAPQLPNTDNPSIDVQLPFVLGEGNFVTDTVMVGHSSGCPLILSVLQSIDVKISQAILVSGFASPLPDDPESSRQILQKYDWEKIRSNVEDIVFINSDNDPWGCNDTKGREMFDQLGGTLIIRHGEGHMGSTKFNQPYKEFPLLLKLIV